MNEIIKKLSNRAWMQTEGYEGPIYSSEMDRIRQESFQSMFARLIVQECMDLIHSEIDRLNKYYVSFPVDESNDQFRYEVDLCIDKCCDNIDTIQKHFGLDK